MSTVYAQTVYDTGLAAFVRYTQQLVTPNPDPATTTPTGVGPFDATTHRILQRIEDQKPQTWFPVATVPDLPSNPNLLAGDICWVTSTAQQYSYDGVLWAATSGGGGGGNSNFLIFDNGATTAGNVYATEAELIAAASAISGTVYVLLRSDLTITADATIRDLVIESETGYGFTGFSLQFVGDVSITATTLTLRSVVVLWDSTTTSPFVSTVGSFYRFEYVPFLPDTVSGSAAISVASLNLSLVASSIGVGTRVAELSGGFLFVEAGNGTSITSDVAFVGNGTIYGIVRSAGPNFPMSTADLPSFTGTYIVQFSQLAEHVAYSDYVVLPPLDSNTVQGAVDALKTRVVPWFEQNNTDTDQLSDSNPLPNPALVTGAWGTGMRVLGTEPYGAPARRDGTGMPAPLAFSVGDTLSIAVDGGAPTNVTFQVTDTTFDRVAARINAAVPSAATVIILGIPSAPNFVLRLEGATPFTGSITLADVSGTPLASIGHTAGTTSCLPQLTAGDTLYIECDQGQPAVLTGSVEFLASGFAGTDVMDLTVDGVGPLPVAFAIGDQTPTQVAARINTVFPGTASVVLGNLNEYIVLTGAVASTSGNILCADNVGTPLAVLGFSGSQENGRLIGNVVFTGLETSATHVQSEINSQLNFPTVAYVQDDCVLIRSQTVGSASYLVVADVVNTPATTLGLATGSNTGVDIEPTLTGFTDPGYPGTVYSLHAEGGANGTAVFWFDDEVPFEGMTIHANMSVAQMTDGLASLMFVVAGDAAAATGLAFGIRWSAGAGASFVVGRLEGASPGVGYGAAFTGGGGASGVLNVEFNGTLNANLPRYQGTMEFTPIVANASKIGIVDGYPLAAYSSDWNTAANNRVGISMTMSSRDPITWYVHGVGYQKSRGGKP